MHSLEVNNSVHFIIALRKLTEMTFSEKFRQADPSQSDDPNREQEWMDHLRKNGYGYIIEEFLKEQPSSERFKSNNKKRHFGIDG